MAGNEFGFDICFEMEAERSLACHRGANTIMMTSSCSSLHLRVQVEAVNAGWHQAGLELHSKKVAGSDPSFVATDLQMKRLVYLRATDADTPTMCESVPV